MEKLSSASKSAEAIYLFGLGCKLDAPVLEKWLPGLSVVEMSAHVTLLRGDVVDQAALYGMLAVMRDLGLPLILVVRIGDAVRQDPGLP